MMGKDHLRQINPLAFPPKFQERHKAAIEEEMLCDALAARDENLRKEAVGALESQHVVLE